MWQDTELGLYKQFHFKDFNESFAFMTRVAQLAHQHHHYPKWENEWNIVQIWLATHEDELTISDRDRELAVAIDALVEPQTDDHPDVTVPHQNQVKVYADGGSRGNPGPSASGFVILNMDDAVLVEQGVYLGITTNNQAEYTALKLALEACKKLAAKEVFVHMDSLLVVNQMKGIFKIRNRELWPIHQAIKDLVKDFEHVDFVHVPRELNKLADAAVNRAMDRELGITHPKSPSVL